MSLKMDTGKKKAEAKGTSPQRFRQALQWAGRTAFRLLMFGAGGAKDKWEKEMPDSPFKDGQPELAEGGGWVLLKTAYNGEDFDVIDTLVLPYNTKNENESKLLQAVDRITGA